MPSTIKAFYCDIDGTLLWGKSRKQVYISDSNLWALQQCKELGKKVILSTGRTYEGAVQITDALQKFLNYNVVSYLVCLNGCLIVDNQQKETLRQTFFSPFMVKQVTDLLIAKKMNFFLVNRNYSFFMKKSFWSNVVKPIIFGRKKIIYFHHLRETKHFQKIVVFGKGHKRIKGLVAEMFPHLCSVSTINKWSFEIIDKKVDKYLAAVFLNQRMGVTNRECCVIGNGENDHLMMKNFRLSVGVNIANRLRKHLPFIKLFVNNKYGDAFSQSFNFLRRKQFQCK